MEEKLPTFSKISNKVIKNYLIKSMDKWFLAHLSAYCVSYSTKFVFNRGMENSNFVVGMVLMDLSEVF